MTRSQAIETHSELLHIFLLFIQLLWPKFLANPDGVLSVFLEPSALDANLLVFGFSLHWNLDFFSANSSSCMKAVILTSFWIQSNLLPVVDDPVGVAATAIRVEVQFFLVAELRILSDSRSGWRPSRVKTLIVCVTMFEKRTKILELSCPTGGWVYILLNWDSKRTPGLSSLLRRMSDAF